MKSKVFSMLDAVADRFEAKGYIKEASEVDIISNTLEKLAVQSVRVANIACVACEVCGVSTPFIKTDTGYRCQKHWKKDKTAI